jgi:hypothetical protein
LSFELQKLSNIARFKHKRRMLSDSERQLYEVIAMDINLHALTLVGPLLNQ